MEDTVFDLIQLYNGKPYWIGPLGCTGSKEASWLGIQEWYHSKIEPAAAMEVVYKYNVGKSIQVLQARTIFFEHLNSTLHTNRAGWLDRHSFKGLERCMDYPDRIECNSHFKRFSSRE